MLLRKFSMCSDSVKCSLFRTYVTPLYTVQSSYFLMHCIMYVVSSCFSLFFIVVCLLFYMELGV